MLSCFASKSRTASTMSPATSAISASRKPRVVTAGEPRRRPLVSAALAGSSGILFLFVVIFTASSLVSSSRPEMPSPRRSSSTRWLSVPPETSFIPCEVRPSARTAAFFTTWAA